MVLVLPMLLHELFHEASVNLFKFAMEAIHTVLELPQKHFYLSGGVGNI